MEYKVVATAEPDIWEWHFRIGDVVKTGRTQTRLAALAPDGFGDRLLATNDGQFLVGAGE